MASGHTELKVTYLDSRYNMHAQRIIVRGDPDENQLPTTSCEFKSGFNQSRNPCRVDDYVRTISSCELLDLFHNLEVCRRRVQAVGCS
jgi:hypothetical protein